MLRMMKMSRGRKKGYNAENENKYRMNDVEEDDSRRTDPKTATHSLWQTARSKCTWTCHKSHFLREHVQSKCCAREVAARFPRACAVKVDLNISQESFWDNLHDSFPEARASTLAKHRP